MSDTNNNGFRPTSAEGYGKAATDALSQGAETLRDKASTLRDTASAGVEAVQATVDDVSERAGQAYTRGNIAVTRTVDPIPALALAAVAGFIVGFACANGRN